MGSEMCIRDRSYIDDYVTVMMRKLEESYFNEYDGVFSGKLSI